MSIEERVKKLRALGFSEERIRELAKENQEQSPGGALPGAGIDVGTTPFAEVHVPSSGELAKIVERFEQRGCVPIWSTVLQDKVAYVKGEAEMPKVPDGFVTYTEHELWQLFGSDAPPINQSSLRLIHEAKKRGGVVTACEWPLDYERRRGAR